MNKRKSSGVLGAGAAVGGLLGVGCLAVLVQLAVYGAVIYGIVKLVRYAWGS